MAIPFDIRYFQKKNGARLAYGIAGSGPPVVQPPGWAAPLSWPGDRPETEPLLATHSLINYDMEGSGLSTGRMRFEDGFERHADELLGLLDRVGISRAALWGNSLGAPVVLDFAARYPSRVACLVTLGGYAKGPGLFNERMTQVFPDLVRANWGMASVSLTDMFVPDSTAAQREEMAAGQRAAFDRETAAKLLEEIYAVDIEDQLAAVAAPTLVIHHRGDRAIPFAGGQAIAAGVPNATLLPLEGKTHLPITLVEGQVVARAIAKFVEAHPPVATGRSDAPAPDLIRARDLLTAREVQVLSIIALGEPNSTIAERLSISVRTVERHVSNLYAKLEIENRAQATGFAIRSGILD